MQKPSSDKRLRILQTVDNLRRWYSLDDKRLCAICDRVIDGHQIEIRRVAGQYSLHCPTTDCPSNFSHWFLYHEPGIRRTNSERLREQAVAAPPQVPPSTAEMSFVSWADR